MGLHNQRALNLRGDPGLLSALGSFGKGVLNAAATAVGVGPILRAATPMPSLPAPGSVMIPGPGGVYGGQIPITKVPGVTGILQRAIPGGATGYEAVLPSFAGGAAPSGYHLNKSGYWTAAGYVPKGTKYVRNRTRNLSNGRANTRALRRLAAWDKQERRLAKTMKSIARGR